MRIGIIGAGQLGQMLGFAARELGVECRFLDPSDEPPAAACGEVIQRPFDDAEALAELAETCDVVTYEFENVPVAALHTIDNKVPVYPPADALRYSQDRLEEKRIFDRLDIPLPGYRKIDSRDDMVDAVDALGLPCVVKTRRFGYDGKGQFVIRERTDIDAAWEALGGQALIAEQWVPFDFELSCIGVRNVAGDIAIYPLARNVHVGGILHTSCSPVEAPGLAERAETYVRRLLAHLDYVGVLALELFVWDDDLRAVMNRPLGSTASVGHAGMVNLIGEIPDAARNLDDGVLHDYGKSPRPGRKLGHITVTAETAGERDRLVDQISKSVTRST